MQKITINGTREEKVLSVNEVTGDMIRHKMYQFSNSKKKGRYSCNYMEIPISFDIETTTLYERDKDGAVDTSKVIPSAFMYHWQMAIDDIVVFGRYWKEFQLMLKKLEKNLDIRQDNRIIIWVHNLAYEFQFFRNFVKVVDGFWRDTYKPIYVVLESGIEFRCSYMLTGLSLYDLTRKNDCFYRKEDDFDYRKIRTPSTKLMESELEYCYCDVRGLNEALTKQLQEHYSTIPLTKTGYVRRDFRNAMRKEKYNRQLFLDTRLSAGLYRALRSAFRGGDTHANYLFSNQVIDDVESWDIKSSYPACMMYERYPIGPFFEGTLHNLEKMEDDFAYLLRVKLVGVEYVSRDNCPYIAYAKVSAFEESQDNGRIITADTVIGWFTDIDIRIILETYKIDSYEILDVFKARYDFLPEEFTSQVREYFKKKTELDGKKDDYSKRIYIESKERLNSAYGMTVTRIDNPKVIYENQEYKVEIPSIESTIQEHYKNRNNFLPYQWGVWITAWARKRLRQGMKIAGDVHLYNDTDSVKCIAEKRIDEGFSKLNSQIEKEAAKHDMIFKKSDGTLAICGIWEKEDYYDKFKTLGAKKYIYEKAGKITSVIAGVSVKAGSEYFQKAGMDTFEIGTTIKESGHLTAWVNDEPVHKITVNGEDIWTASNIALVDNVYTIGISDDYEGLLRMTQNGVTYHG